MGPIPGCGDTRLRPPTAAVPGLTGRNPTDRILLHTPPVMKKTRLSHWQGAVSLALVSRSRAMPVGDRWPVLPVGARCRAPSCPQGYAPRREPSRRLGSLPPRPCGPRCRCEHRRSLAPAQSEPLAVPPGRGSPRLAGASAQSCIARQTFSGVSGVSRCSTPKGRSASITALTTAGVEPMVAASPMPFTPSGFTGVGVTVRCSS